MNEKPAKIAKSENALLFPFLFPPSSATSSYSPSIFYSIGETDGLLA